MRTTRCNKMAAWLPLALALAAAHPAASTGEQAVPAGTQASGKDAAKTAYNPCSASADSPACVNQRLGQVEAQIAELQRGLDALRSQVAAIHPTASPQIPPLTKGGKADANFNLLQDRVDELFDRVNKLIARVNAIR